MLGTFRSAQTLHSLIDGVLIGLAGAVMLPLRRSLVATASFIALGVATVFLLSEIGIE